MLTALDVSNCPELLSIYCNLNQLTAIDVSNNTQLLVLYCGDNALTTLDVTQNTELTTLYCPNNDLTQLDITQNPHLYALYCFYNNLAALDLSQSHELALLSCGYNPGLTALYFNETPALMHLNCLQIPVASLDMSACPAMQLFVVGGCAQLKNINLKNGHNNTFNTGYFNLSNLPALETVCVDDEDSVFADWVTAQTVEGVTVTETCILDVDDVSLNPVAFYPNPVSSMLYIKGADVTEIYLYNNLGQKVGFYEYTVAIDVSALPDGIYFVKAKDAEGALTTKSITKHSGIGF
jgi:hypothetical protein